MRGRFLVPVVAALALALPASASAVQWTVDPGVAVDAGTCNAQHVCKSINGAVDNVALASGDDIKVLDGAYTESKPIQLDTPGVTIEAANPLKVSVTLPLALNPSSPAQGVFTIVEGDHLDGLIISSPTDGGPAVHVDGANTTVSRCVLAKTGISTRDTATYDVDETVLHGVNLVDRTSILSAPTASSVQTSATVEGSDHSSMALESAIVFAGGLQGPAVRLRGNDNTADGSPVPNRIRASILGATNKPQPALAISAEFDNAVRQATELDSTLLTGGATAPGMTVHSETKPSSQGGEDLAGPIGVTGVHVTIAGSQIPFAVNAESSGNTVAKGNINVTFDRSIIHGAGQGTVKHREGNSLLGLIPISAANEAHVLIQNSDTTQLPSGSGPETIVTTNDVKNDDTVLFVDPVHLNFHLNATSPAIDKAGPKGEGESTIDFDADPRVAGPASDLGADEFVNHAPTASATVSATTVRQNEVIVFDASKSSDPDGPIAQYVWNFGDGTTQTTTTPTTTHSFVLLGDYNGSVSVIDPQGASSAAFQLPHIRVNDGLPPTVKITSPTAGKAFKLYKVRTTRSKKTGKKHTTKTLNKIKITGTATDEAGVASADLQLRRLNLKGRTANLKTCVTTNGKTPFKVTSCKTPEFFRVSFKDGKFSYTLKPTQKLKAGTYQVSARATDKNGNTSVPVVVKFTLK